MKLKKPIPTRPERNVNDGVQNFHSQPAPPRALHLTASDPEHQKTLALLLDYDQRAKVPLELNGLQAALQDALRVSGNRPTVLPPSAPASSQTAVKLSAAQTVSQRVSQQLGRQQAAKETHSLSAPHGGFKMTAALSAQEPITPQKGRQFNQAQGALSLSSLNAQLSAQTTKAPSSKAPQTSSLKNLLLNATEAHSLSSATQALLRGNQNQMLSQGGVALPRPQGSPQKNSQKYQQQGFQAALNSLQVNTDGYASGSGL